METNTIDNLFNQVKSKGLNMYPLLSKLRKRIHQPNSFIFPEEVLIGVCRQFLARRKPLKNPWPWFCIAIKHQTEQWNARKNMVEHQRIKQEPVRILDILGAVAERVAHGKGCLRHQLPAVKASIPHAEDKLMRKDFE